MLEPFFIILITCANLNSALGCMQQVLEVSELLPSCEAHGEIIFKDGARSTPVVAAIKFECLDMPETAALERFRAYTTGTQ